MAFDPSLFAGGGIDDPSLVGPSDTEVSDPEDQEILRLQRNDIATKAGYPSWDAYLRAVGSNRALQQQEAALQIQKLQLELTKAMGTGGVSPSTAAQLAQAAQQFNVRLEEDRAERAEQQAQEQTKLAETQRQFNETFGANKAKFNIEQQFAQSEAEAGRGEREKDRELSRGNTLLQLGSRPDTLVRYLFALRGQQAPQGLGTPPALPGYPNVAGVSAGAPAPQAAPSLAAPAPAPVAAATPIVEPRPAPAITAPSLPQVPDVSQLLPQPQAQALAGLPAGAQFATGAGIGATGTPQQPVVLPDGTTISRGTVAPSLAPQRSTQPLSSLGQAISARASADPTLSSGGLSFIDGVWRRNDPFAEENAVRGLSDAQIREAQSAGRLEEGGVIPELVMGMGMDSGQMYTMGEEAHRGVREVVVPEDKVPKDIFERLMKDAQEVDYSEDKTGKRQVKVKRGMNSYANGGTLGYKPIDPKVFNPSSISNEFDFPQIGNLTGGTSLVPSAQRLFGALPSERSLYAGYLQDEQGVQSDDVFELARRLAPQTTGMTAGKFIN